MKSCPAAGYQVDDAAERLGDTGPNPHGGEDDLSSNQTATILQNTSTDIAADLRGRFTLFLLSPLFRNRASDFVSTPFWLSSPAVKKKTLQVAGVDALPNCFPPDTRLQDPEV